MNNNIKQEVIISILLAVLLLLLVDPFGWMPPEIVMILLVAAVVLYILFVVFVWREKPMDEREEIHQLRAGRIAYLFGSLVLVIGLVVMSFQHDINYWVPLALGVMVLSKVVASAYNKQVK